MTSSDMPDKTRIVAVMGGGDWNDASCEHLVVPETVDLNAAYAARSAWYENIYKPEIAAFGIVPWNSPRSKERPEYFSFAQWLVRFHGAREATHADVTEFFET